MAEPDLTSYKAFQGLRNDVAAERFAPSDLEVARNVDIDKSGQVARRAGYTALLRESAHSLWAKSDIALYVSGTTLKRLNDTYTGTTIKTGLTPAARMSYAEQGGRVYFSNGHQTGVLENGAVRSWGLPVPPLPGVAVGSGNMPAGAYQYGAANLRADGQISGCRAAGVVEVPAGGSLVFSLPACPDPGVVAQEIYLSTPNGDALYVALTTRNDGAPVAYMNDTTELAEAAAMQFMAPAPAGQLVGYYKGRMFVASGDVLFYSEPFAYELFDLRNYIVLDGRITLMAALEEKDSGPGSSGLFIGTDRSCGALIGTDPDSFEYVPKTAYGAILGALDYVDGSLYQDGETHAKALPMWLSAEGICVGLPGMEIKNLTRTRYGFQAAGEGAALFRPGPNQFIAVSNY